MNNWNLESICVTHGWSYGNKGHWGDSSMDWRPLHSSYTITLN
jgi:hypothetical protein